MEIWVLERDARVYGKVLGLAAADLLLEGKME
jgi:hypothetical protein